MQTRRRIPIKVWVGGMMTLIIVPTIVSVESGYLKEWLDKHGGKLMEPIAAYLNWSYADMATTMGVGLVVTTWLFLRSRAAPPDAVKPQISQGSNAAKGFLDYQIETNEASARFQQLLTPLARKTGQIGPIGERTAKQWANAGDSAKRRIRILKTYSWHSNRYSQFLEKLEPQLRQTICRIGDSWLGIVQHAAAGDEAQLRIKRGAIVTMKSSVLDSLRTFTTLRDSIGAIRNSDMSQDSNAATERMMAAMNKLIALWEEFDERCDQIIGSVDRRLSVAIPITPELPGPTPPLSLTEHTEDSPKQ